MRQKLPESRAQRKWKFLCPRWDMWKRQAIAIHASVHPPGHVGLRHLGPLSREPPHRKVVGAVAPSCTGDSDARAGSRRANKTKRVRTLQRERWEGKKKNRNKSRERGETKIKESLSFSAVEYISLFIGNLAGTQTPVYTCACCATLNG